MRITKNMVRRFARQAWDTLGDLKERIDVIQVGTPSFNPVTGRTTAVRTTHANIIAVFPSIDEKELNPTWGVDVTTDAKVLILVEHLPIDLASTDEIYRKGVLWKIVKVCEPIGNIIHVLYIREA